MGREHVQSALRNSNFLVLHRPLIHKFNGDLFSAVLLSELVDLEEWREKNNEVDKEGYFVVTNKHIYNKIKMTRKKQDVSLRFLKQKGLVDTVVRGVPPKRRIRIRYKELDHLLCEAVQEYEAAQKNEQKQEENEEKQTDDEETAKDSNLSQRDKLICADGTNHYIFKTRDNSIPFKDTKVSLDYTSVEVSSKKGIKIKAGNDYPCPDHIEDFLETWEENSLRSFSNRNSKTFMYSVEALKKLTKGILFNKVEKYGKYRNRKFTLDEFNEACKNLKERIDNPLVWPRDVTPLKRMSIDNFLLNPSTGNSMFIFCLENTAIPDIKLLPEPWEEKFPGLTDTFIDMFKEEIPNKVYPQDRAYFVVALGKIIKLFEGKKTIYERPGQQLRLYLKTIGESFGDVSRIKPKHLGSELSFEIFQNYVKKNELAVRDVPRYL